MHLPGWPDRISHSALCECGWQVGPWPGRVGGWLVGVVFHRHLKRCST